jgi:hypothetical protein
MAEACGRQGLGGRTGSYSLMKDGVDSLLEMRQERSLAESQALIADDESYP